MERVRWTDERLEERLAAIDQMHERIFEELRALRGDFAGLRGEFAELRGDFARFQDRMIQIGFALVGVIIAAATAITVAVA